MALDTDTKRTSASPSQLKQLGRALIRWIQGAGPSASSRLAQLILVANLLALGVLIFGMLALTETRRGLVNAKLDSLTAQGELIANVLAEGAAVGIPTPALNNADARALLRQLYVPEESRVLLFDKSGETIADSHLLADVFERLRGTHDHRCLPELLRERERLLRGLLGGPEIILGGEGQGEEPQGLGKHVPRAEATEDLFGVAKL